MKVFVWLLALVVLSSFAYAGINSEINKCGNDIRCKFRVADKYQDAASCDTLDPELVNECRTFIGEKPKSEAELQTTGLIGNGPRDQTILQGAAVGIIIVISVFIFMMLYLFVEHHKHASFVKDHTQLVKYVKNALNKDEPEGAVKQRLVAVGWKEGTVKEALRDAKHMKK